MESNELTKSQIKKEYNGSIYYGLAYDKSGGVTMKLEEAIKTAQKVIDKFPDFSVIIHGNSGNFMAVRDASNQMFKVMTSPMLPELTLHSAGFGFAQYEEGGEMRKALSPFSEGDKVIVQDNGPTKYYTGFDISKPATIISVNRFKQDGRVFYGYQLRLANGDEPFNPALPRMLKLAEGKFENGGDVGDDNEIAEIFVEGSPYYISKMGDSTHFRMSNTREGAQPHGGAAMVSHVGQHNDRSYINDVKSWLKGGPSPEGKKYDSRKNYEQGGMPGDEEHWSAKYVEVLHKRFPENTDKLLGEIDDEEYNSIFMEMVDYLRETYPEETASNQGDDSWANTAVEKYMSNSEFAKGGQVKSGTHRLGGKYEQGGMPRTAKITSTTMKQNRTFFSMSKDRLRGWFKIQLSEKGKEIAKGMEAKKVPYEKIISEILTRVPSSMSEVNFHSNLQNDFRRGGDNTGISYGYDRAGENGRNYRDYEVYAFDNQGDIKRLVLGEEITLKKV